MAFVCMGILEPIAVAAQEDEGASVCPDGVDRVPGLAFFGESQLINCIRSGHTEIALRMIEEADPDEIDNGNFPHPLIYAALAGDARIVEALLKRGASPNEEGIGSQAVLVTAANAGYVDVVKILLKYGADINRWHDGEFGGGPPLVSAAIGCQTEVAQLLVERGADINQEERYHGWSALWAVACSCDVRQDRRQIAEYLLRHGADVDVWVDSSFSGKARYGITPLGCAAGEGDASLTSLLLSHGADPRAGYYDRSILELAKESGNTEVVRLVEASLRAGREEASDSSPSANSFNDKLFGSGQLQGQLLGFQQGDYIHALVRSDEGRIINFFVDIDDGCFLAINKDNVLHIEYDNIERYFLRARVTILPQSSQR